MRFFDFKFPPLCEHHRTAFDSISEAVHEQRAKRFSLNSWSSSRPTSFRFASIATRAIVTSKISLAGISSSVWLSLSSPIAAVSATSKPVCAPSNPSSITWASEVEFPAPPWPTPTSFATGASIADFAQVLIGMARDLYRDESFGVELGETVYAFDSTTIDLCLSLFPWAQFRRRKSAVKLHTLLDLRGSIPTNVYVTGGQSARRQPAGPTAARSGSVLLARPRLCGLRSSLCLHSGVAPSSSPAPKRICSSTVAPRVRVERSTGLRCDQTILPDRSPNRASAIPSPLRRIALFRCREGVAADLPDQQFSSSPPDHRPTVSGPLAGGIVLPLDQTAPAASRLSTAPPRTR